MGLPFAKAVVAGMVACGLLAAGAATGDVVVEPGGELTVGPNGLSTNNSQGVTVTFEDGGTITAIRRDSSGVAQGYHRLWRPYFINGTVTYDGSDLPAGLAPEFRCGLVATNGTLRVSSDRTMLRFGSGSPDRTENYPLFDAPNIEFLSGGGTVRLEGEVTLRDRPGRNSTGITFEPNGARLAIAGQGVVSDIVDSSMRVKFGGYGDEIVLLDESYIPEGVTPAMSAGKTFRIYPADVVYTNENVNAMRVVWRAKEGSGVIPFDIDLNGGTLELVTTRAAYEFTGKIYNGGTIDLQGPYTRTLAEVEGTFAFKNTTSGNGTVVFRKVNPGSRLCDGGGVTFVFEDGALPANAVSAMYGKVQYVFVPAADGTVDMSGMEESMRATSAFVPLGADVTLSGGALAAGVKIGVTNAANVTVVADGEHVPTVVGGDGMFTVDTSMPRERIALWLDASAPYDTATKGAPTYAAPGSARAGSDFGNIFFTNGLPFVEAWYDVRGTERTWRFYLSRYYDGNDYKIFNHVYPYVSSFTRSDGQTMSYLCFGVNGPTSPTISYDGPDKPAMVTGFAMAPRLINAGGSVAPTAVIMVFGSQQGGGIAMLGGGSFTRSGRTLSDPVCNVAPANTTIWLDGDEVDPTVATFNGGWQVVSVVGAAAATVSAIGQNTVYSDSGGQNYGEILFFTNTVTELQRRQFESYLAKKWGIATYRGAAAPCPVRAEGRSGAVTVADGAAVELRGTFAGSLTVNGAMSIAEPLPWTEDDVPSEGRVDWYDASDSASLVLTPWSGANNVVARLYPRGTTQRTLTSGYYLWGGSARAPFAVTAARGLGAERTWIDYNHPEGFPVGSDDGNVMRFLPYDKSDLSYAEAQTFRTFLVAMDSSKGGGTILGSNVIGGSGDFRTRYASSYSVAIWPSSCAANVRNGTNRLNGVVADPAKGLTGAPEVLSLTAAGNVSALCVDTINNTQTSDGVPVAHGMIQGEMLMYDSVLDADVLANLEAYLMGKWTGVLPDGWSDLREATVTAGTGTVSAVAARLPAFGDGFTGTVIVPDTEMGFAFDGASGTVDRPLVARGATLSLPAAVTVSVACENMSGVKETSVPIFDVAGFSNPVTWTLVASGTGGRKLKLREAGGRLLLDVLPAGATIIFR